MNGKGGLLVVGQRIEDVSRKGRGQGEILEVENHGATSVPVT